MGFDSMRPTLSSAEGAENCFNVEFTERQLRRWWPFGLKSPASFVPEFPAVVSNIEACYKISWKNLHSDNGVFNSKEFRAHCKYLKQKLTFSGVGAHHQNGIAEIGIHTVCNMARADMLHATVHCA